jgi:hypothetical protein
LRSDAEKILKEIKSKPSYFILRKGKAYLKRPEKGKGLAQCRKLV